MFYIINQNQIKLFIKRRPILYKLASELYNLHPSRLIPQSKQKLEKDAAFFWQRPKAGDLQYEKSHSNHCGARRWDKKKFIEWGNQHYEMYLKALFISKWTKRYQIIKATDGNKLNINVVDWGVGGGANMLAFAKNITGTYYGIDISNENLEECYLQATKNNIKNFKGILIDINDPENIYTKIKKCDLFICTEVFPYFPHKDYAERITKIACNLLTKGGIALLHVLLKEKRRSFHFHIGSYSSQVYTNTTFTYEEYIEILKRCNLQLLYITRDTRDTVSTFSYFHVLKQ